MFYLRLSVGATACPLVHCLYRCCSRPKLSCLLTIRVLELYKTPSGFPPTSWCPSSNTVFISGTGNLRRGRKTNYIVVTKSLDIQNPATSLGWYKTAQGVISHFPSFTTHVRNSYSLLFQVFQFVQYALGSTGCQVGWDHKCSLPVNHPNLLKPRGQFIRLSIENILLRLLVVWRTAQLIK